MFILKTTEVHKASQVFVSMISHARFAHQLANANDFFKWLHYPPFGVGDLIKQLICHTILENQMILSVSFVSGR